MQEKDLETGNGAPVKWQVCMENQRGKFVYYIVEKYLENLCEFMQINLDVDTTWKEILFYVV